MTDNLPTAYVPMSDLEKMAIAIVNSKLFGISTREQAIALMLVAQSEGLHPARAAIEYNIIQNKPALKADAMMARFQKAGGTVKWGELSDKKVSATFSHPQGGSVTIDWDMERAKQAELGGKDMWKKYPRQMLRSRVISEGIRTVFPGVISGQYAPEEVIDFTPDSKPAPKLVPQQEPAHDAETGEIIEGANLELASPVMAKAREEAAKGTAVFREWWKMNKHVHDELKPHTETLKALAERADERLKDAA